MGGTADITCTRRWPQTLWRAGLSCDFHVETIPRLDTLEKMEKGCQGRSQGEGGNPPPPENEKIVVEKCSSFQRLYV